MLEWFPKNKEIFMDLVDTEYRRITERPEIIVLLASIPYDNIVKDPTASRQFSG